MIAFSTSSTFSAVPSAITASLRGVSLSAPSAKPLHQSTSIGVPSIMPLYRICVIYAPVDRCGSQSCIRSNRSHVNVVSNAGYTCRFAGSGSACSIGMLADQYAAVGDQSVRAFFFKVKACPAVGVFYLHCHRGAYALGAQIERGVSGNNLSVGERAYINPYFFASSSVMVPSSIISLSFMPATTPDT